MNQTDRGNQCIGNQQPVAEEITLSDQLPARRLGR
jgi:hypothetical protein